MYFEYEKYGSYTAFHELLPLGYVDNCEQNSSSDNSYSYQAFQKRKKKKRAIKKSVLAENKRELSCNKALK